MAITKKLPFKIPAKQGEWPDLLKKMQTERLALQKQVDEMEANEKLFKEHMIQTIPKSAASGISGKEYKVQIVKADVPQVEDWESLYKHILKTKDFGYLNRALNKKHVEEVLDSGKNVPGVKLFEAVKVSLTKI